MSDSQNDSNVVVPTTTTASLLTGVGRSAIAVIGITGPLAAETIEQCFAPATKRPFRQGQIRYGNWCGDAVSHGDSADSTSIGQASESVVVLPIEQQEFEIHCHGGIAATSRILDDLRQNGVHVVDWQSEHWQAATPLLIRESKEVLCRCTTARSAAIALDQVRGALLNWCRQSLQANASVDAIQREAHEILRFAELGLRLPDRFGVVLAGPPNVGKSSLINAIVGYDRSITMDQPGTTRDVLQANTVIDGLAIRLSDTAGIRDGDGEIEQEGIRRANQAIADADLVVWVATPLQFEAAGIAPGCIDSARSKIDVLNKADLLEQFANPDLDANSFDIHTVATLGQGVPELMAAICHALVPEFPASRAAVPTTLRQVQCLKQIQAANDPQTQRNALQELLVGGGCG
ncbi:GTPase [Planctomycetes bacterium K23_9]|uniref:tRNA modification GTPase MnmE n=1 Tax=Stieleria marina TaxID=1930275 RepID=A0A517P1J8_9BACT|nr:tRNA modification GTPase MnmE [Planctomycetes bacterium K23_9]